MLTKRMAFGCAWITLCAALVMTTALPQRAAAADDDDPPSRVARLSYLRGSVSFQPAGESDWVTATINRPMTTGDKLWADADSRAELRIGSAAIRLNGNTGFSFLNLDDRTVQIQLSAGTLSIRVRRLERDEVFEVDTPNQAFSILRPGRYRLEASEDGTGTIVTVLDGQGESSAGDRTYTVESRERASLTGTDFLSADIDRIDRRDRDDFDEWSEERDQREDHSRSVRYVSPEMVGYEDLDENGVWRHDPEYGEVWVPTGVPAGWAPYHYGHWAWIAPWGWTWVDDASWGYAPFHYGRWAYARGAWCWVPGPIRVAPVYAPALVAFVGGPSFAVGISVGGGAAVGWFPLGPREVYVPAYRTTPEYVTRVNVANTNVSRTTVTNVYNTTVVNNTTVVHNVTYVNRNAPGGVTAVSRTSFTSAQPVATTSIRVNQSQIVNAPVVTRAEVAPTQNSVLGHYDNKPGRPIPPGQANRAVVARTTPPPPPVSFERQQSALAAHPGRPLERNEVENLRPAEMPHSNIRQMPPNRPDFPNRGAGRVDGAYGTPNRQSGNPADVPGNGAGNRPANNPSVGMPPRNDRPDSVRPDTVRRDDRPAATEVPVIERGNRRGQQNRPEQPVSTNPLPSNNQPPSVQPSYRPPFPDRQRNSDPSSNERPSLNNQPQTSPARQPSNNRPSSEQPIYRPLSPDNRRNPGAPANERPPVNNQPQAAPAPQPANNGRSGEQPIYRPLSPESRSNPGTPSSERPSINQPSARPITVPNERPAINSQPQPAAQPNNRRVEPPSNAPVSRPAVPENRSAAPSSQPSGSVRAVPESRGPAPNPAPARSNNNASGNKKEHEKRN